MDDSNPLFLLKSVRGELQTIQRQVDYLIAVLDSQAKEGLDEIAILEETSRPSDLAWINSALHQMAGKHSQEEILEVLLAIAAERADRVILFEAKNGKLEPWKSAGIDTEPLSGVVVTEPESPLVLAARQGEVSFLRERFQDSLPWLSRLGPLPASCLCLPLTFGSFVPFVLYADSSVALNGSLLEVLVRLAVLHLQNHYMAHLLQKVEEREIVSSQEETATPETAVTPEEEIWKEDAEDTGEPVVEEGETVSLETETLTREEEEAAHEEARRLARLLVAEIKLYNEGEVEEGRKNADLYRRLRTDIDRSRKMYEKRVHPSIKAQADYFNSEVIRVLAHDDASLMGNDYQGSEVSNPVTPGNE